MKLNSRSLKVGDKIIRKCPINYLDNIYSLDSTPSIIKEKHPHHIVVTVIMTAHSNGHFDVILPLSTWNDKNWVRWGK